LRRLSLFADVRAISEWHHYAIVTKAILVAA
jgi:hypothetical protein